MSDGIVGFLRGVKHRLKIGAQRRTLRAIADGRPAKIIIGTSGTGFKGWIGTDREVLDLLRGPSWEQFFTSDRLDAILAEHVWEHLAPADAATAAALCHRFLKPGGYLRVAVPDGFHPDTAYVDAVKPGGTGWGSDDHKVLYTYRSFSELFAGAGFEVRLLEYFDEAGKFVSLPWSPEQGMIRRSQRFDVRNQTRPLAYTSIVLDAIKPVRQ